MKFYVHMRCGFFWLVEIRRPDFRLRDEVNNRKHGTMIGEKEDENRRKYEGVSE